MQEKKLQGNNGGQSDRVLRKLKQRERVQQGKQNEKQRREKRKAGKEASVRRFRIS